MNLLDKIGRFFMQHCPGAVSLTDPYAILAPPSAKKKAPEKRSQGLYIVKSPTQPVENPMSESLPAAGYMVPPEIAKAIDEAKQNGTLDDLLTGNLEKELQDCLDGATILDPLDAIMDVCNSDESALYRIIRVRKLIHKIRADQKDRWIIGIDLATKETDHE